MHIISLDSTRQNIWDRNPNDNVFKIDGMTSEEWVRAKAGRTYEQFWGIRDAKVQNVFNQLWDNSRHPGSFPVEGLFKVAPIYTSSVEQVLGAMTQWEKMAKIISEGGSAFGFDIETFGDAIKDTDIKTWGITEVGIGRRTFDRLGNSTSTGISLVVGISKEQKTYIDSVATKLETQGWDALSKSERITVQRISMYAPKDAIGSKNGYLIVNNLGPETRDAAFVRQGAKNLHNAYKEAKPQDVFNIVLDQLRQAQESGDVLFGANSLEFDIPVMTKFIEALGITSEGRTTKELAQYITGLNGQVLDTVYASRALGIIDAQGVDSSIEGQLETLHSRLIQVHSGGQDVKNEGIVTEALVDRVVDSKKQLESTLRTYDVTDSMFLVHSGIQLKHQDANDIAIVNGKPVNSYSIGNEYWQVNQERSGEITLEDGTKKYALVLDNVADIERGLESPTSVSITYDSFEQGINDIANHSSVFKRSQVTQGQILSQQAFKYEDFGRREFARAFNPAEVGRDGNEDIYGVASLKKYLRLSDDINEAGIEITNDSVSVQKVLDFLDTLDETDSKLGKPKFVKGKNRTYQAQAFVGMYTQLQNERPLLEYILNQLQDSELSNADQTIVARRAYERAIQYMDDTFGRHDKKTARKVMSDALGVDVYTPDGSIKRINIYNTRTATNDINRIFKGLSSDEILTILDDVHGRGLFLDEDKYQALINNMPTVHTNSERFRFAQNVAYALEDLTAGIFDKDSSVLNAAQKSFDGTLRSISQDLQRDREKHFKRTKGNRKMSFEDAYKAGQESIETIVRDTINDVPNTTYLRSSSKAMLETELEGIAKNLNLIHGEDKENLRLLTDLFNADKPYAISKHTNRGLRSLVIQPNANSSAYILLTTEQNYARVYSKAADGEYDFTSRQALIDSGIHDDASFIELPKINEYQMDSGVVYTVNQGKTEGSFEKILIPELRVSNDGGPLRAYYNNAEYGFVSQARIGLGNAIEQVLNGNFEAGTRAVRNPQNAYLKDMTASASMYGVVTEVDGKRVVKRVAAFGPSDFIQGYKQRVSEGLYSIFKHTVDIVDVNNPNLNIAQQIVKDFGESVGILMDPDRYKGDVHRYLNDVASNNEFKEFFMKRLFIGQLSDDALMSKRSQYQKNLFSIIKDDIVAKNISGAFDTTVLQALNKIETSTVFQVLSKTSTQKGDISRVSPGEYNDAANIDNTMRPVFTQASNGMYFNPDEMDLDKMQGLNPDAYSFDTAVWASQEWDDRMALIESGYKPAGIDDYENLRRHMVLKYKQMSDYDLQIKYQTMRNDSAAIISKLDIDADTYEKALTYFENDMMSVYQDKIYTAPGLNEQELFQRRDATKITIDIDNLDTEQTKRQLKSLVGQKIDRKTVIGIRADGSLEYYKGPITILEKEDVDNLLDSGETKVIPLAGDIADNKIIINSSEKGTVHSIDIPKFMEFTGIKDRQKALRVANGLFTELSDGAVAIANQSIEKHGNLHGIHTIWNTITTEYQKAGLGEELVQELNRQIGTKNKRTGKINYKNKAFTGMRYFRYTDKGIISDAAFADNYGAAILDIYEQIQEGTFLIKDKKGNIINSEINDAITNAIVDMNDKNIGFGVVQRQMMNEHMGTRLVIDQRFAEGIRIRGMDTSENGGNGLRALDVDYEEHLRSYSLHYDATGKGLSSHGFTSLQEYMNVYSRDMNLDRIRNTANQTEMQRSVRGIVESLMFYDDLFEKDRAFNIDNKNIVKVNINDLIDQETRLKAGMSSKELQESVFFVNGEPSQFLKKLAKKQGINIKDRSYSIYLDFNQTKIRLQKGNVTTTTNGVLIPIQSTFAHGDDKAYFQNHQKATVNFINKAIETITNPKAVKGKGNQVGQAIGDLYSTYIREITPNLATMKKDSDFYKAFQRYVMPTSQQLLAQDEVAPLIEDMMKEDTGIQQLITQKRYLEDQLRKGYDKDKAQKLDTVYKGLDEKLSAIAKNIRDDDGYYSKLMSSRGALSRASELVIDGKKHYGMVLAISEEAFERQGFNLGAVGLDVIADFETNAGQMDKIAEFHKIKNLDAQRVEIASRLNALNIEGLQIDDQRSIVEQLDAFVSTKYGDSMITTKDLNKALINQANLRNQEQAKILDVFRGVGLDYMTEVGTYGEFNRYPDFRSQPMVRVIVDRTLSGTQFRASNPILSALSNLDFDGDTSFLAMIADGMSVMKKNSQLFQDMEEIYTDFVVKRSRGLLAELIEDGEVFKVDRVGNYNKQIASTLEKFHSEKYEKAMLAWASEQGLDITSVSQLTKAQKYAAESSSKMTEAFKNIKFNTILDENIQIASIAARLRQDIIGGISTPNYLTRNSILVALKDPRMNNSQRRLLNDTFVGLTNMFSKAGGFFSEIEQKGIDVKHVSDGLDVARTLRYTTGLNMLFDGRPMQDRHKHNLEAVYNIISSVNASVFKASEDDMKHAASVIVGTNLENFDEAMRNHFKNIDDKTLSYYRSIRQLLAIQEQIPEFSEIYRNSLYKGSFDAGLFDMLKELSSLSADEAREKYRGTSMASVVDVLVNPFSKDKDTRIIHDIYFKPGRIVDNQPYEDTAYIYAGDNVFKEIDLKTMQIDESSSVRPGGMIPTGVNFLDYKQSASLRTQVSKQISDTKFEYLLNDMTLKRDGDKTRWGAVRKKLPDTFLSAINSKSGPSKFSETLLNDANRLFTSKTRTTPEIYSNVNTLTGALEYARAKGMKTDSVVDLIKSINQDIAQNREKYAQQGLEYDTILHDRLVSKSFFGSEENLNKYVMQYQSMPDFDTKKYQESLDFLNRNAYDIMEQEAAIQDSFKSVEVELEALRKQGIAEDKLQPLADTLASSKKTQRSIIKDLRTENAKVIRQTENEIYDLFDNTAKMDTFFSWGKTSGESIVGFGEFIGRRFSDLSKTDIEHIQKVGVLAQNAISKLPDAERIKQDKKLHAITQTLNALEKYNPIQKVGERPIVFKKSSIAVAELQESNSKVISQVLDAIEGRTSQQITEDAQRAAAQKVKRQTISGAAFENAKEAFSKIPKKAIGIGIASMAALGIVNNALHNQRSQSPLTPSRARGGNTVPNYNSPATSQTPVAPMSKRRTVYHDSDSGFNFKVSAKTRSSLDDQSNAKLIGMSGGGNASIHSQSDMSGVTDNWLANKFAELT